MALARNSQKRVRVVLALPAVPGSGPVPQRQPRVPGPSGNIVVNDDEGDRVLAVIPAPEPIPRGRKPTGIVAKADEVVAPQNQKVDEEPEEEPKAKEADLPEGTLLLCVAGEELPKIAVGPALEFIEFCNAFYEPMEMKEADAQMTLREIVRGCKLKRGWQSHVVRVHVRLLSVILSDESVSPQSESEKSWLKVLKSHVDKASQPPSMGNYAVALAGGADGYLSLTVEEKLQLLNMLCNDALSAGVLREHIQKVLAEYDEKKEDDKKREIKAGKSKVSSSEPSTDDKRTASVRTRSAANLPETSDSSILGNTETFRSDAVKTEAIVWNKGSLKGGRVRALWKLKGGEDRTAVISQVISDIGGTPTEEWAVYSEKDKGALAVYLDQRKHS